MYSFWRKKGKPLFLNRYGWTTRWEKEQPWILTTPYIPCCILSRFSCIWLPGSSVHGILQARILEWVAISSSGGSSWPRERTHVPYIGRRASSPWSHNTNSSCFLFLSCRVIQKRVNGLSLRTNFNEKKLQYSSTYNLTVYQPRTPK